ncbi:MAG: hypothetical protein JJ975_17760, partial [Bacteroidia bacterium]|nr:hypothetical protein [Bacteroidia bacterium]
IDLDFNFQSEGLDPKVNIQAFGPNVSYKTASNYFSMVATTEAKSLKDSKKYQGSADQVLHQMIKTEAFTEGFAKAINQLMLKENEHPEYGSLWEAKR